MAHRKAVTHGRCQLCWEGLKQLRLPALLATKRGRVEEIELVDHGLPTPSPRLDQLAPLVGRWA